MNTPNSPASNSTHKAATAPQTGPKPAAQTKIPTLSSQTKGPTPTEQTEKPTPTSGSGSESQDVNRIAVPVGKVEAAGLVVLVIPLMLLFNVGLHQKVHNGQNQQPSVLCQKTDGLTSSFEVLRFFLSCCSLRSSDPLSTVEACSS